MWEINIGHQALTLIFSLCLGGVLCTVYDVLRASRKVGLNSFIIVFISDIVFWIISAFTTFIFLMARTCGEIRGYVLAGEFAGFLIFRLTLSRLTFPFFKIIFNAIRKLYLYFEKAFAFLYSKTDSIISKISTSLIKIFKRWGKSIKKLLKSRRKVLYTNENDNDAEYVLNETKT